MKKNLLIWLFLLINSSTLLAQVINNFEPPQSNFNNATFKNKNGSSYSIYYCNVDTFVFNQFFPSFNVLNSSTEKATLVSNVNEPILASSNIIRPTISPSGGTRALRLNNTSSANYDITSYTEKFHAINKYINFEYFAVLASDHPNRERQPMFRARLLDQNNNIIPGTEFCLIAETQDPNLVYNSNLFYSDNWYCHSLVIPEEYLYQQLSIEFVVADCGLGGHIGVLYIDNIYNLRVPCDEPQYGFINLENHIFDSCDYLNNNNGSLVVNGIYNEPANSSLSSVNLYLTNLNNTYPINVNNFNFNNGQFQINGTLPPNLPLGEYEINIDVNFIANNNFTHVLSDTSTENGPDISLNNTPLIVNIEHDEIYGILINPPHWNPTNGPYTIKYISDGYCCPNKAPIQNIDGELHTIITNDTNLNSLMVQMMNIAGSKCLRFKVIDACGQESDWCCMTSYSHEGGGYTGEWDVYQCIDEIDYDNLIPEYSMRPAVYPNPTTGEFQIVNNKGKDFKIYDLSGNLVHKKIINTDSSNVNFDVSNLINGNYILIIDNSIQINIIKK